MKDLQEYRYSIVLEPDPKEGGYTVIVPALPGCVTEGDTLEEAVEMAKDAIRGYIESLRLAGEPVPAERAAPKVIEVLVAA
jgi:antitoxin HicB